MSFKWSTLYTLLLGLGLLCHDVTIAWTLQPSSLSSSSTSPPSLKATTPNNPLTDLLSALDDKRDIPSLQEWATKQGVVLAEGVQLVDNGMGDWGVGLSENSTHAAHTPIMTVPPDLILSSDDPSVQPFQESIIQTMSLLHPKIEYFAPECLLMLSVLQERAKGSDSRWYDWLQSLPPSFTTGLYLDSLERSHVQRLAPEFLQQQEWLWEACQQAILKIVDVQHDETKLLLLPDDDDDDEEEHNNSTTSLLQWAFSVVFTRSWRTAAGNVATLVPLGDMFNHDSARANIAPSALEDGSIQLSLKNEDQEGGSPLWI